MGTEITGCGVGDGHLRLAAQHHIDGEPAEEVGDEHGWAGTRDAFSRAEKEAGTNSPAEGNESNMALGEAGNGRWCYVVWAMRGCTCHSGNLPTPRHISA